MPSTKMSRSSLATSAAGSLLRARSISMISRRFGLGFTGMSTILHWGTLEDSVLNSKNPSEPGGSFSFHRSLPP